MNLPVKFLLLIWAGWVNRAQQDAIDCRFAILGYLPFCQWYQRDDGTRLDERRLLLWTTCQVKPNSRTQHADSMFTLTLCPLYPTPPPSGLGNLPARRSHHPDYCCGGKQSLEEACREKSLDPSDVLAKLVAAEKASPAAERCFFRQVLLSHAPSSTQTGQT